jgi:hypothetical protein
MRVSKQRLQARRGGGGIALTPFTKGHTDFFRQNQPCVFAGVRLMRELTLFAKPNLERMLAIILIP